MNKLKLNEKKSKIMKIRTKTNNTLIMRKPNKILRLYNNNLNFKNQIDEKYLR